MSFSPLADHGFDDLKSLNLAPYAGSPLSRNDRGSSSPVVLGLKDPNASPNLRKTLAAKKNGFSPRTPTTASATNEPSRVTSPKLSQLLAAAAGRAAAFQSVLDEAIRCTENPLWATSSPAPTVPESNKEVPAEAFTANLQQALPEFADAATASIAAAIEAEANANFGDALQKLRQARGELMMGVETREGQKVETSAAAAAAVHDALAEIDVRIASLIEGVRSCGLRCPLFAPEVALSPSPVRGSGRFARSGVSLTPRSTPRTGVRSFLESQSAVTPQERKTRMEEVNAARKRLEALAAELEEGDTVEIVEGLFSAAESFGYTLRNSGDFSVAISHLQRAVEIVRCMHSATDEATAVSRKAASFDVAIRLLIEARDVNF